VIAFSLPTWGQIGTFIQLDEDRIVRFFKTHRAIDHQR